MENIKDIYPLSPMQEGMLFHSIYAEDSKDYKEQFSCRIIGELQISSFKNAWEKIIERHDILRTAFIWEDLEEPLQIVHEKVELPFIYKDISEESDKEKFISEFSSNNIKIKFNFAEAPLMRISLLKLKHEEHYFNWDHHHILFDGWGLPIIMQELLQIYSSEVKRSHHNLKPTMPYKNYIAWIRNQDEKKSNKFWKDKLKGFSVPTKLKMPFADKHREGYLKKKYMLPIDLSDKIFEIIKKEKITINTITQAAWAFLLSLYTNSNDIAFGATFSGRNADVPGIGNMVGLFINTLPIRIKIIRYQKIIEWLKEIQLMLSKLQEYEYSALYKIQKLSEIPNNESLFNTLVVFENYPVSETLEDSSEELKIVEIDSFEKTNYPLTIVISPGKQIGIEIAYDTMEFDDFAIEQIADRYEIILKSIVANINKPINEIEFNSIEEVKLLEKLAQGEPNRVVEYKNTKDWFENIVEKNPEKLAVISEENQISFSEMNKQANKIAKYLLYKKISKERLVGICLNRSVGATVSMMGIIKAGAAFLPIDPNYPIDRIKYILEDSKPDLLITEKNIIEKLDLLNSNVIYYQNLMQIVEELPSDNNNLDIDENNLCYLIYTSGSTGIPKAMCLHHAGLCNFVNNSVKDFSYSNEERILQFSSLGFDGAIGEIFSSLLSGNSLYIPKREVTLSEADLADYIKSNNITFAYLPPSFLSIINPNVFGNLLKIASVGDKCSSILAEKWGSKVIFYNGYGPTETSIGASFIKYGKKYESVSSYPIGKGFGNVKIYLLNANFRIVPIGVEGEIYIAGKGVGRGYLNKPDLTAERFFPDIFANEPGLRMYRTGDKGKYLPDGNIEFIGRKDFQVKIRGFRIELNEIEAVITKHLSVKNAVVIANKNNNGDEYLSAYIIRENNELSEDEIYSFIKKKLPEYMLPKTISFLEEFPLSPNNKVDRNKLPKAEPIVRQSSFEPPKNSTEEVIANIWSDILKIDNISRNSNFFELGGHSLSATQLISRLRDTFKKEIPFQTVFDSIDLKDLSNRIENDFLESKLNSTKIDRISRDQNIPLSYSQQRLWFLDQLRPGDSSYNIPTVLRITGDLNFNYLERSLNLLIEKYEILRTTFESIEGKPYQKINEKCNLEIQRRICVGSTNEEKLNFAKTLVIEKSSISFDLSTLFLLRCEIIEIEKNDNILFFLMHHIIADGWSISLLINELISIYSLLQKNISPELNKLDIEYADYSVWQHQQFLSENFNFELQYWKDQLKYIPPFIEFPYDKPKPNIQTSNGGKINIEIEEKLVSQINKLSKSENSTLFMSLLAVFQLLLSKYTNMNDIVVGTPIAGRNNLQFENLVGFFVNNLAIRTKINKNDTFRDLLVQVRDTTLNAYSNQNIPFDKLVEELHPQRDLSHQPIFQTMFVYQNLPKSDNQLSDLEIIPFDMESQQINYEIVFTLQENDGEIKGSVDFNTDLFEKDTIERFVQNYKLLIRKIVGKPDEILRDKSILSDDEKVKILEQWSLGKTNVNKLNVVELFEKAVDGFRVSEALVFRTNSNSERNISLTYEELNKRVNQLANYLKLQTLKPEEKIAICMQRHEHMIIALFAILKTGCTFLPIDPSLPKERIEYMLNVSECNKIIINNSSNDILENLNQEKINLDEINDILFRQSDKNLNIKIDLENLAYIIFTSGSTGIPKGVMLNHNGLANLSIVQKEAFNISNDKKILQFSSLSFDASIWETVMALLNGGVLYLTSKEVISSGYELAEFIDRNKITTITLPPSVLSVLPSGDYQDLGTLITAGEAISNKLVSKWSISRRYINAYGPTETTVCATMLCTEKDYPKGPPIGKSIDNFSTYVLDSALMPLGIGIPGELCIGGIGLARGYMNQSDLTAEKFIPNPFSRNKGERLYRTGDLVKYLPDGNIEFLGRIDSQVKLRGFRIEVSEIEHNLKNLEFIKDAAVLVRNISGNQELLVGYVVCDRDDFEKEKIQKYLRDKLPEYMIPTLLIRINEMPLTTSGKIDKNKLPVPNISREELGVEYVAPRNEEERNLVKIVEELLHITNVGVKDNFFELGGHSLLATQFISRIKNEFNKELKLIKIFEDPTIEGVLRNIENTETESSIQRPLIQKIARESRRTNRTDLS
ncbi:MAG: amino acid adenylation domain-containing protein [Melioribacteraceae bacterium]